MPLIEVALSTLDPIARTIQAAPRPLKLNKNVHAYSAHIVIPLENAVFCLPGTVNRTVHFVDRSMGDLNFSGRKDLRPSQY
jgi:hypothetical protein